MNNRKFSAEIRLYTTEINHDKTLPLGHIGLDIARENTDTITVKIQKGVVVDVIKLSQADFDLLYSYFKLLTNEKVSIVWPNTDHPSGKEDR